MKAFKSYFDELYGKGLDVANWHLNSELEPFDNFYESALQEVVGEKLWQIKNMWLILMMLVLKKV